MNNDLICDLLADILQEQRKTNEALASLAMAIAMAMQKGKTQ